MFCGSSRGNVFASGVDTWDLATWLMAVVVEINITCLECYSLHALPFPFHACEMTWLRFIQIRTRTQDRDFSDGKAYQEVAIELKRLG